MFRIWAFGGQECYEMVMPLMSWIPRQGPCGKLCAAVGPSSLEDCELTWRGTLPNHANANARRRVSLSIVSSRLRAGRNGKSCSTIGFPSSGSFAVSKYGMAGGRGGGVHSLAREWRHRHVAMYQIVVRSWCKCPLSEQRIRFGTNRRLRGCMRSRTFRGHRLVAAFGSCAGDHA